MDRKMCIQEMLQVGWRLTEHFTAFWGALSKCDGLCEVGVEAPTELHISVKSEMGGKGGKPFGSFGTPGS